MTRIAVVADIHGNLPALRAVVADIARRVVDAVVNLGDTVSGPLWPRETAAFVMEQPWCHIAGNCDRQVARDAPERQGPSDRFAFDRLTADQRAWLASLPATAVSHDEVLAFHGTPSSDSRALLETVERGAVRLARPAEIADRLGGASAKVMLCAHTHVPRIVRFGNALIVNPGSVGLPAYHDDSPEPHAMETGTPDARYAILEQHDDGWRAMLVAVPYDHREAAAQALRNGRQDWERGLSTGYMTP